VCDMGGLCDTAVVYILVETNQKPIAKNDHVNTNENTSIEIGVQDNDFDPDGDSLVTGIITKPINGTANLISDGGILYSSYPNYHGKDSIIYRICDDGAPILCDTAVVYINVIPQLVIPTGFSPNGDDYNDHFVILGIENFDKIEVLIFNRWGNKVFTSIDYKNDWDGTNQSGQFLPDATYFYVIKLTNQRSEAGYITIHR
ncbi:MAG: gliding motility-associated C-terminal domain-containing protein, partial [Bacteroidetes bacterium]|nr:gliding motility-associated C-terminal domain-containing protein [Bacteroidota bacterium]